MSKKITVVTVCFNAAKTIKNTIESVLNQNYDDFEYIIVDGKSSDDTYKIVESYDEKFKEKNVEYIHNSKEDNGIFDAMNKAASIANGEWIIYMNADDTFYNNSVLSNVSKYLKEDVDVVYGNTIRLKGDDAIFALAKPSNIIYKGMPFCHQSSLTRTALVKEYGFDLKYRVADYNLFLHLAMDNKRFVQTDVTIANYSVEGYSNKNKYKTYKSILDIKNDLGLINKKSLKQKIKNIYFYILLNDKCFGHRVISKLDNKLYGRR